MGYATHFSNNFYGGHMYQQGIPQDCCSMQNNRYYLNTGGMPHFRTWPNHGIIISRHYITPQMPTTLSTYISI